MAHTLRRNPPDLTFSDEGCMAHFVYKSPLRPGGPWKVEVRFYGRVEIDGVPYEWNDVKHVTLKKQATEAGEK